MSRRNENAHLHNHKLSEHKQRDLTNTTLATIATNTANIKLSADSVNLNVDGLETLQTTANATLAAILVDTDAADSSLNTIEAQSVFTASRLNNIQNKISANVDGTGSTLGQIANSILAKNTEIETLQTTANTTLASILVDTDAADSSLNTIEAQSVLTASRLNNIQNKISANADGTGDTLGQIANSILAKNTEIETSANAIQSAVEGTLTVGSHAVTNAGTFAVQAACSGTVTANLSATDNAVLDAIAADGDAIQTKLDTLETTLTAIETDQAAIEVLLTAANVDHAANEVLLTAISADGDAIQTKLDTLETSANAIQSAVEGTLTVGSHAVTNAGTFAVQAACSGTVTANLSATDNAVLDAIDAVLDTIKVDTEAIETATEKAVNGGTTGEWLSSAEVGDDNYAASVFDASAYKTVRFFGKATADIGFTGFNLLGSQTTGGTFYNLGGTEKITKTTIAIGGTDEYHLYGLVENCPNFIKLYNATGAAKTFELDYIGYCN